MCDIPDLNQVLDHLQQLQATVSGMPLRDQIVHLPQLQKAMDEIELRKRVLERLRQTQVILRQADGPNAWQWILQSLRKEVATINSVFYGPPPLPVSFPDLEAAERARAELEAWVQAAPLGIPISPPRQALPNRPGRGSGRRTRLPWSRSPLSQTRHAVRTWG
jgi:hypothetical protein